MICPVGPYCRLGVQRRLRTFRVRGEHPLQTGRISGFTQMNENSQEVLLRQNLFRDFKGARVSLLHDKDSLYKY